MQLKTNIDTSRFTVGVVIARFQVDELHKGQKEFLDFICANHSKVIIFLGVPVVQNTKRNPLDFATRKAMVQEAYPDAIILPLKDQRSNENWSKTLDQSIQIPFGETTALLYGSRDSFIPYYSGKFLTAEIETDVHISGTDIRKKIAREVDNSSSFRRGVISGAQARRDITYPAVDIVAFNENGEILLVRKPAENLLRFAGGFVDRADESYEYAAKREFMEETACGVEALQYITSRKVDDWRYRAETDGIMTILFMGKFPYGHAKASDDLEGGEVAWVKPADLVEKLEERIMPEHIEMMKVLLTKIEKEGFPKY